MRREQILEAAARLFAKNGYAKTSTLMLAKEAGVAEGTIFRHFKSKEQVFLALIIRLREKMVYDVSQRIEAQEEELAIKRIETIITLCFTFVRQNNTDFALLLRDAPGCYGEPNNLAFEHVKIIFTLLMELFKNTIEAGQKEGNIRKDLNAEDTAVMLTSSLVGLMRSIHLEFLQPSKNIMKNYIASIHSMLEVR